MTAKLTLIGQPQHLKVSNGIAAYTIMTGPASNTAPKGLALFKKVKAGWLKFKAAHSESK